ncbi:MAG: nuclear transport factor 2 family protein [Candidatus Eremiobacteraeota bacterium]|nr:nuclear transport factor 2 family protein [Candidatus Eremiobacteraeota bacterium]
MSKYWQVIVLCAVTGVLTGAAASATPGATPSATATTKGVIWSREIAYWSFVQANDLTKYRSLWNADFLGWPSVSTAPVRKDHITDWITSKTGKGLRFKTIGFKRADIQVTGSLAASFYWITFEWVDKNGNGTPSTTRVMHTWLKVGSDWQIIDGMSSPQPAAFR